MPPAVSSALTLSEPMRSGSLRPAHDIPRRGALDVLITVDPLADPVCASSMSSREEDFAVQHAILQGGIDTQAVENPGHGFGRDIQCSVMRAAAPPAPVFSGNPLVAVDYAFDNIAGVEIVHQLQRPLHRVIRRRGYPRPFKTGRLIRYACTQRARRAADAVPAEFRALEKRSAVSGLISLFRPPMMPARQEGVSASAITSISLVRVCGLSSRVVMASPSFARRTMIWPPDVRKVKGVHRLAGFEHDKVGDVDDVVDRAHAAAFRQRFIQSGDSFDAQIF